MPRHLPKQLEVHKRRLAVAAVVLAAVTAAGAAAVYQHHIGAGVDYVDKAPPHNVRIQNGKKERPLRRNIRLDRRSTNRSTVERNSHPTTPDSVKPIAPLVNAPPFNQRWKNKALELGPLTRNFNEPHDGSSNNFDFRTRMEERRKTIRQIASSLTSSLRKVQCKWKDLPQLPFAGRSALALKLTNTTFVKYLPAKSDLELLRGLQLEKLGLGPKILDAFVCEQGEIAIEYERLDGDLSDVLQLAHGKNNADCAKAVREVLQFAQRCSSLGFVQDDVNEGNYMFKRRWDGSRQWYLVDHGGVRMKPGVDSVYLKTMYLVYSHDIDFVKVFWEDHTPLEVIQEKFLTPEEKAWVFQEKSNFR